MKNRALTVITVIAVMAMLHFTRPVALPIALAIFAFLLLNPAVERISRTGLPRALAVLLVQAAIFGVLASIVLATADPLVEWFRGLPQDLRAVRTTLLELREPILEARESAEILGELSELGGSDNYKVEVAQPTWIDGLMERGPMLLLHLAIAGFLGILLLLTAPGTLAALRRSPVGSSVRRRVLVTVARAQRDVSRYLSWVIVINTALGAIVAVVMALLGMESPLMWGVLAGLANFVPYVGPLAVLILLWVTAVVQFGSVLAGTWPALAFLVLTSIEGQLVTPAILGRHLAIPPPLIFVAILLFGWSWGLVGAFLAVPALVTGKAVLKYWPAARPADARRYLAHRAGSDPADERRVTEALERPPTRPESPAA